MLPFSDRFYHYVLLVNEELQSLLVKGSNVSVFHKTVLLAVIDDILSGKFYRTTVCAWL